MQFVNHLYVTESDAAELVTVGKGFVDIKSLVSRTRSATVRRKWYETYPHYQTVGFDTR